MTIITWKCFWQLISITCVIPRNKILSWTLNVWGPKYSGETKWILWLLMHTGSRFNIKISSYQYRKSHCGDKTVVRSSYLHNGISYTGKMTSLYWFSPLASCVARTSASKVDVYYLEEVSPCLPRGRISTTSVMSVWRNDVNCRYMFMFFIKHSACKGLKRWPLCSCLVVLKISTQIGINEPFTCKKFLKDHKHAFTIDIIPPNWHNACSFLV